MVVTEQNSTGKSRVSAEPALSVPAADKHSHTAAVTTAMGRLLIQDPRAGLAPIPTALYMIGLNWSAQVNFAQEI